MTGPPSAVTRVLRVGQVVFARYELKKKERSDLLVIDWRATDELNGEQVLLRFVNPELSLDHDVLAAAKGRLLNVVGGNSRHMHSLLGVEQDGRLLATVESVPQGTTFRAVLDRRMARGAKIEPHEALPLIVQLDNALAAIPNGWCHGDLRPQRVWLSSEGVMLTGPYLLAALPAEVVADCVRRDPELASALPYEAALGELSASSDRYGVARIAFEGLTGHDFAVAGEATLRELGVLGDALRVFLESDHRGRPASLSPLIAALADATLASDVGIHGEPEATAPEARTEPRARMVDPQNTRRLAPIREAQPEVAAQAAPFKNAAHPAPGRPAQDHNAYLDGVAGNLAHLSDGSTRGNGSAEAAPTPSRRPSPDDSLDPRLVRAALGIEPYDSGVAREPTGRLDLADVEMMAITPPGGAGGTQKLSVHEIEVVREPAFAGPSSGPISIPVPEPGLVVPNAAAYLGPPSQPPVHQWTSSPVLAPPIGSWTPNVQPYAPTRPTVASPRTADSTAGFVVAPSAGNASKWLWRLFVVVLAAFLAMLFITAGLWIHTTQRRVSPITPSPPVQAPEKTALPP